MATFWTKQCPGSNLCDAINERPLENWFQDFTRPIALFRLDAFRLEIGSGEDPVNLVLTNSSTRLYFKFYLQSHLIQVVKVRNYEGIH